MGRSATENKNKNILNGMRCVGITSRTRRGCTAVYHKLPKLPLSLIKSGAEATYTQRLTIEVVWITLLRSLLLCQSCREDYVLLMHREDNLKI